MAGKKAQHEAAIVDRRRKVARLYLSRYNQTEIAEQLGVNQSTVSRDVAHLKEEWRKEGLADISQAYQRELAELNDMERDAAVEAQRGRAIAWYEMRLKIKRRRAELMGLDAPAKMAPTSPDGKEAYGNDDATGLGDRVAGLMALYEQVRARTVPDPDGGA